MKPPIAGALAALLLAQSCARAGDGPDAPPPPELLYRNSQCGGLDQPAVTWIASPEEWRRLYGLAMNSRMNPPPAPAVDFSREGVLVIAMGQRPSSGYGLSLAGDATVRDGVLTVPVDWREPPPGTRQAQVITNPCLLLKVPAMDVTRLRVMDREGRIRLEGDRSQ
ncbi:MAG: protease complex subunit PrcB family protein [Candidatus Competibacter sp.]|nr:protease complex subunit PrcB family protein [Candidatus Competibacter sp.]